MTFQPGHKLSKGRPKGSPNKASKTFQEILDSHGINLIDQLMEMMASGELSPRDKMNVLINLLPYRYPKRQVQELSGPDGKPMEHVIKTATELSKMSQEELIALAEEEIKRIKGE